MNCRLSLAGAVLLAIFAWAQVCDASETFKTGITQYNSRQYGPAAKTFAAVLKAEPRNAAAAYYMANSYYQMGQAKSAMQYYQWITQAFPGSREAAGAAAVLKRSGVTASAAETSAGEGGGKTETSGDSGEIQVVVVKALGDHPQCTPAFINEVKAAVKSFPPKVIALAARNDCKIYVSPTMIDKYPELKNSRPQRYEQGRSYKNCPALFDSPNVVVCQYCIIGEDEDDNWQPTGDAIGSLRHEFGHAIDDFMGNIADQEEFKHTYEMERTAIKDPDHRSRLSYYIQEGRGRENGTSETFAEGCSIIFGGASSPGERRSHAAFKESFPNVLKLIQKTLNSI